MNKNTTRLAFSDNGYNNINNNNNNNNISSSSNSNILSANHLFSQSISVMTRRGQASSNPLPAIGEANALPAHHHAQTRNSSQSLEAEQPLSPRGATAWGMPGSRAELPPLRTLPRSSPNFTGGGFSVSSPRLHPTAPDYDMFQAKE